MPTSSPSPHSVTPIPSHERLDAPLHLASEPSCDALIECFEHSFPGWDYGVTKEHNRLTVYLIPDNAPQRGAYFLEVIDANRLQLSVETHDYRTHLARIPLGATVRHVWEQTVVAVQRHGEPASA